MEFKEFEKFNSLTKEISELHKSFSYLSTTAQLIVADHLRGKYKELEEVLRKSNEELSLTIKKIEDNKKNS